MDKLMEAIRRVQQRLRRRGRTREEAEDLTQEAMLRVLEYCGRGGEVREPEAVLSRAAHNLSINEHHDSRRSRLVRDKIETLSQPSTAPLPEDILEADQCLERMQAALMATSEQTRNVFLLHRVGGWSYSRIAASLGITESAVEKHVAKASLILIAAARLRERP